MTALRLLAAFVVAGVALSGALYLHNYTETRTVPETPPRPGVVELPGPTEVEERPDWADPAAVLVAVAGLGLAGGILLIRRS